MIAGKTISDPHPHPWRIYPRVPVLVSEHEQLLASMNERKQGDSEHKMSTNE